MKKILILTGGRVRKLSPFVREAAKLNIDLTTASLADLEYDLKEKSDLSVKIKGKDIKDFDALYFRLVGGNTEEASILTDYARKNKVKIADRLYGLPGITRLPLVKGLETKLLIEAGIPVPETLFIKVAKIGKVAPKALGYPYVIKSTTINRSRAVWLINGLKDMETIEPSLIEREEAGERFLAQKYIPSDHRIRVFVVGGKAMAGLLRPARWRKKGVKAIRKPIMVVPKKYALLAEKAANALYLDVAGPDIIEAENGELYVLEVNSAPSWNSIKRDTKLNVESEILNFLSKR